MAKFCHNCGAQLDDAVLFCPSCGTQQAQQAAPQPQPASQPQPTPQSRQAAPQPPVSPQPPKKKKTGLIAGVSAAAVAVIAIVCAGVFWIWPNFFSAEAKYDKYMDEGDAALEAEDYEAAVEAYTRAIDLDLDKAEPYIGRGDAYNALEQYDDAIDDYESALAINEADADLYLKIANTYIAQDDTDAALKALEEGLEATEGDKDIEELIAELDPPAVSGLGDALSGSGVADILPEEVSGALSGAAGAVEDAMANVDMSGADTTVVDSLPDAAANTMTAIGNTLSDTPYAALGSFFTALVNGTTTVSLDMADDEYDVFMEGVLVTDLANLEASLSAQVVANGDSASASAYIGPEFVAANSPLVDSAWYGATYATLLDDLENSIFVEQGLIYPEDIEELRAQLDMLMTQMAEAETAMSDTLSAIDLERYLELLLAIEPSVATGQESGRDYVSVEIPFDVCLGALSNLFDALSGDTAVAEIYAYIASLEGYDPAEALAEWPEMMAYAAENMSEVAGQIAGSAKLVIYMYDGYIETISILANPNNEYGEVYMEGGLRFAYDGDRLSSLEFYLWGQEDGYSGMDLSIRYEVNESTAAYYSDIFEMRMNDGYSSAYASVANEWDRGSGAFSMTVTMEEDGYADGGSFAFNLLAEGDRVTLSADTYEMTGVEGEIALSAAPGVGSVNRPSSYVNLDQWDMELFDRLEAALMELETIGMES